ncbi:LAQU0S05e02652g1_1 [Lachancea quebecensis]|uniref:LAQU0S05e02652g1_1 n=1 Tax=Lachancea quebecensis TaxID=1654605 RepID=A0A0P1KS23_9SACH|nr:LAQU0S05e02652g1_1 [Lachancea quebecensis]
MSISLEQILGFKVRITNVLDVVSVGSIYSYNSSNNTITLLLTKTTHRTQQFKVIKLSFVKSLEVIGERPIKNSFRKDPIKPIEIKIEKVKEALQNKVQQAKGVTAAIQEQSVTAPN